MRRSSIPLLVLLVSTLACSGGGEPGDPDGGGGTAGLDDDAYFGLQSGACFRYTDAAGLQEYTVGVGPVTDILGVDTPTRQISYRMGGFELRRDFVSFDLGRMLVHRRETGVNDIFEFDPPFPMLIRPLQRTLTSPTIAETTVTDAHTGDVSTWTVRIDVDDAVELALPAREEAYEAWPVFVSYERDSPGLDKLWVTPEAGPVKIELGITNWNAAELQQSWQSEDGSCTNAP